MLYVNHWVFNNRTDMDQQALQRWCLRLGAVGVAALVAACSTPPVASPGSSTGKGGAAASKPAGKLPPVNSVAALKLQAARRMVETNPGRTFTGPVPDQLLAIPVLEIELHADGSIKQIDVMRHPRQAKDTTQIAMDAVRQAAPFGDVSRMPKPWKFTETFLFNEQRQFKPRSLD